MILKLRFVFVKKKNKINRTTASDTQFSVLRVGGTFSAQGMRLRLLTIDGAALASKSSIVEYFDGDFVFVLVFKLRIGLCSNSMNF